ncbi:murein L,D-transpeptidase catalytic domain family protein [Variovorax sp. J22R133]|uniref:murein L,D-transpeptidase catalytic domain-containing protein n=1 Tax=Variovorax brevis TaxID=3053503 RepID=UPI002575EBFE|nr:murein L,D-transpeptidase catalytic domain family protein [Variovorax sp. J22R133]MDM0117346.1 murein L,D-transpeptidase catalytic domain family protein [Variovorax sp. J22R133]
MKRRNLLQCLPAFSLALGMSGAAPALAQSAAPTSPDSLAPAIAYVLAQPSDEPYAAVLDYSAHSSQPRFHIIERETGDVVHSFLVAHGIGSEPDDNDGVPTVFVDEVDSNSSSLGLFRTDEVYMSQIEGNGRSMRLQGLSPTNRNAYKRAVVIHAQWYVEPDFVALYGRTGRSDGCMVFSAADRDRVVELLQGGALIYAVADTS